MLVFFLSALPFGTEYKEFSRKMMKDEKQGLTQHDFNKNPCPLLTTAKRKVTNSSGPQPQKVTTQFLYLTPHQVKICVTYLVWVLSYRISIMAAPVLNVLASSNMNELMGNIFCYNPPQLMNFLTSSYKTRIAAAPVLLTILETAPR